MGTVFEVIKNNCLSDATAAILMGVKMLLPLPQIVKVNVAWMEYVQLLHCLVVFVGVNEHGVHFFFTFMLYIYRMHVTFLQHVHL